MKNKLKLAYILLMLFDVSNAQNNESNKMTVRKSNQFIAVEQPALNVLYRGIENLIHIAYGGNCKLLVKINNGTIVDKLDGNYAVFVNDSASCEISIIDFTGKQIKTETISNGSLNHQIDISHLSNGVYLCEIKSGTKTISRKFIKE